MPQARQQLSHRTARELGSHNTGPEDGHLLRGRTRGETARYHGARMGYRLLSLMAAREGIGHILFHQPPPDRNPPLPTRPASELLTPPGERAVDAELVCRSMCGRVLREIWRQSMEKEFNGLVDVGTFGVV